MESFLLFSIKGMKELSLCLPMQLFRVLFKGEHAFSHRGAVTPPGFCSQPWGWEELQMAQWADVEQMSSCDLICLEEKVLKPQIDHRLRSV